MNKHVFGRKLSRSRPAREALFSSLMRALILSGKIETTQAKAKAIQRDVERLVTLAKKGDLSSRRRALAKLDNDKNACNLLFQKVAPAFSNKSSGFSRVVHLPVRRGDAAKMVRIEWTENLKINEDKMDNKKEAKKNKVEKELESKKER